MTSNENRQKYKNEIQVSIREGKGEIADSQRLYLETLAKKLNLTAQETVEIEDEIRIPIRKYENALIDKLKQDYPKLKEESVIALQLLQQELKLADVDVVMIVERVQQMILMGEFKDAPIFSLFAGGMGISFSTWLVGALIPPLAPVVGVVGIAAMLRGMYNGGRHFFKSSDASNSLSRILNNKGEEVVGKSSNPISEQNPLTSDSESEIIIELTDEEMSKGTNKSISTGLEKITVKIPGGVTSGKRIRIKGKGKLNQKTQQREDLYLIVKQK
ncbi:chaperone DnaJ domain protein [Nostoc sp. NIES-3756]|uniref:DnaJ C-terminal domain-containing protein n=1 Tax=Nostoc sp. NIES-3756 TaxID=1751286 RepID=UPI000721E6D3|nr:DnaJ C-terminal domain-containing protein [Nostoc sp. NIES-3756]BAT54408.1 chaperone DnaJ domain protein [Nostoc sp. NIES-3756]